MIKEAFDQRMLFLRFLSHKETGELYNGESKSGDGEVLRSQRM